MYVSRTRTVLIDKSQYLMYAVSVIQTPYTINSMIIAHSVTEIELHQETSSELRRFSVSLESSRVTRLVLLS